MPKITRSRWNTRGPASALPGRGRGTPGCRMPG